jgi:uncharacterized protein YpuA (DUF1002 family)
MNSKNIMKGAILAICLIGMLVLPVAAAPVGQGANGQTSAIDQGLKDDLWNNHHQYRLQEFDLHVQRANSVISILNNHNIDTTQMQATLTTISGERATLDTALTNKDKEGLKTINADLLSLWKQFAQEMKDSIKAHYTAVRTTTASTTGTAGTTGSPF